MSNATVLPIHAEPMTRATAADPCSATCRARSVRAPLPQAPLLLDPQRHEGMGVAKNIRRCRIFSDA
jgi:hypothetical protein